MTGKTDKAQALMPKLRFPEFEDAGEWLHQPLGEFSELIRERAGHRAFTPLSITSGIGLVSQEEKFGRAIAGQQLKNYLVIRKGDFAYNKSATKIYPQGYAVMFDGDQPSCVPSSIFTCFSVTDISVCKPYINYLLVANFHGRWLAQFTTIGARANGSLNVDDEDLLALPIPLPTGASKFREQQRIADCLSSLDALIAAEGDRLAALRDYKKGLIQQLFPRPERIENGEKIPAETTPRLRFPEFQDAADWTETRLASIGELISGLTYSPSDVRDSGLLVLRSANIQDGKIDLSDCVYVNPSVRGANEVKPDDILICVRNGSKSLIGKNALIPDAMPLCTHGAFMTIFRTQHPNFVFQLFQTSNYQQQVAADLGATINSINGAQLLRYQFHIPGGPEQHRISEFLSAIDERIASQNDRLKNLKAHKSGLMQQLFPSPAEAAA